MLILVALEDMLVDDCVDLMFDVWQFEDRRKKHARIPDQLVAFFQINIQKLFGSVLEDVHILSCFFMAQLKAILTSNDVIRLVDALRYLSPQFEQKHHVFMRLPMEGQRVDLDVVKARIEMIAIIHKEYLNIVTLKYETIMAFGSMYCFGLMNDCFARVRH